MSNAIENKQTSIKGNGAANNNASQSITNPETTHSLNFGSISGNAGETSSWILDLNVRVVTTQGKEFTGRVYTYDTIANILIIMTESKEPLKENKSPTAERDERYNFKIIKINAIKSISPVDPTDILINETKAQSTPLDLYLESTGIQPHYVNMNAVIQRHHKAISDTIDLNKKTNRNAPENGQEIFNALSKMFPCKWDKNDIVVLDEVVVKPPYTPDNCFSISPAYDKTLDRIKRTLEAERKKLSANSKSNEKPPSPSRKSTSSPKKINSKRNSPTLNKKENVAGDTGVNNNKKDLKKKA
ncbi:hypothetical protein K502DRAFT_367221 [Neoconidiobolus thromboides FSU 785]|nr:hypothetical protein K502DRAFT_367221 [Neoconidiobolus thromboides FSU 785]